MSPCARADAMARGLSGKIASFRLDAMGEDPRAISFVRVDDDGDDDDDAVDGCGCHIYMYIYVIVSSSSSLCALTRSR